MKRSARRHLVVLVAFALLIGMVPAASARSGPVELGAAANNTGLFADPDPRYRSTLALYDGITAESAMKLFDLQPERDRFEFATADAIVAFADANGQKVHGHALAWCEDGSLPAWLVNRSWSRTELLGVLDRHITTVLNHFRGRIPAWDVVNEAFNADGTIRDCLWSRYIGSDWVEQAFRFARRADPGLRLYYNEVRAEVPNPKYEAMAAMARDFRARGVPLDGVGMQMHLTTDAPPQEQMEEAIRRIGELGLDVHISEMDVPTWYMGRTVDEKLARQSESYRRVAAACQAQPACFRITTWGFTDRYTWRGASSLPLPFDSEYGPKPAWPTLLGVLRTTPPAPPSPPPPPPAPARVSSSPPGLFARVRRQRLLTWLRRHRLPVVIRLSSDGPAHVVVVARLRARVIATAERDLGPDAATVVRLRLGAADRRRLRRARGSRLVVEVVATGSNGAQAEVHARARLR